MVRRAEEIGLNRLRPSRGKAPSRIHRDWGPTVRPGFLSAESGANSVQVLPVSLLPWPARFSGLDSRRGRCLAETPAERLRFSGGAPPKPGAVRGPMWRSSERSRSGWDGEFESPLLQRRVSNEPSRGAWHAHDLACGSSGSPKPMTSADAPPPPNTTSRVAVAHA